MTLPKRERSDRFHSVNSDELRDLQLASLADALALRACANRSEYEWLLQCRLGWGTYQRFRELRDVNNQITAQSEPEAIYATNTEYFEFVASHPELCRLQVEARLNYYDAILPRVAAAISDVPHARILDLGCFAGITSLYLGRLFPESEVLGVERLAGALGMAEAHRARSGLTNVSFQHGDYVDFRPVAPFEVVVSLQTVPCHYLPEVASITPEDFARGNNLWLVPEQRTRPVRQALTAMRAHAAPSGRLVMHERLHDLQRALMFHYLLTQVGFELLEAKFAAWNNIAERAERQSSPFIVAVATEPPTPFDEALMIDVYSLPEGFTDLTDLPTDHIVSWQGLEAQTNFRGLVGQRDDVTARADMKNGTRLHCHLGVLDSRLAYVYLCDTRDNRKLMVGHTRMLRSLFDGTLNEIRGMVAQGDITRIEPPPNELSSTLARRWSHYGRLES